LALKKDTFELKVELKNITIELQHSRNERKGTWQHPVSFYDKLYGDAGSLELTAAFFRIINVNV
jgi:hypothetical protein